MPKSMVEIKSELTALFQGLSDGTVTQADFAIKSAQLAQEQKAAQTSDPELDAIKLMGANSIRDSDMRTVNYIQKNPNMRGWQLQRKVRDKVDATETEKAIWKKMELEQQGLLEPRENTLRRLGIRLD